MAKEKEVSEITFPALELLVGVNFTKEGKKEETRIEPGVINLNVLPAAFQNELIGQKKAQIVDQ